MRSRVVFSLLLCACVARAQNPAPPPPAEIPPDAPVITVQGVCPGTPPAAKHENCSATFTRAQFDKLTDALEPNLPPSLRSRLADNLVQFFIMSEAARSQGLENDPATQELLRYQRMAVLTNALNQRLQRSTREVKAAAIDQYYREHTQDFEQVKLRRLYIPKTPPPPAKRLSDAERTKLAADMRKRLVAGEDFDTLQKAIYSTIGLTNPPPTNMGPQRRGFLPEEQQDAVFAAKIGEITPVLSDTLGEYVYKVEAHETLPLESVRADINRTLQDRQYQDQLNQIFGNVKVRLDPQYFGRSSVELPGQAPSASPEPIGPRTVPPPAPKPPAKP